MSFIDPEKKFSEIDFSNLAPACGGIFKKDTANIRRCGETNLNYFVVLCKKVDGKEHQIGEMDFMISENNSVFIVNLRNNSINRWGETIYKGVGTALLHCAKRFVQLIGGSRVYLSAMTPFSTNLPKNHDIVSFYLKQDFTIVSVNSYATRMEWINKSFLHSEIVSHVNVNSGLASSSTETIVARDKEAPSCFVTVVKDILSLLPNLHETWAAPGAC